MDGENYALFDKMEIGHPIHEMVMNCSHWDTLLVCADGRMKVNRLTVGLIFPSLRNMDILQSPVEHTIILDETLLDDVYSMITVKLTGLKTEKKSKENYPESDIDAELKSNEDEDLESSFDERNNFDDYEGQINFNQEERDLENENDVKQESSPRKTSDLNLEDLTFDVNEANAKFKSLVRKIKNSSTTMVLNGAEKTECSMCNEVVSHIYTHVARKHSDFDFKCPSCSYAAGSLALLKDHYRVHGPKDAELKQCDVCQREVLNLKAHIRYAHTDKKKSSFHCSICKKSFGVKSRLNRHMNSHLGMKDKCPICNKELSAQHIPEHMKQVHQKEKRHCCPECGKGFFAKRDVEKHLKTHEGYKSVCNLCGKSVSSIENHMTIFHSGIDRRVVCPQCGLKFVNLKEHIREVHEKIKNFSCPECDFTCYKRDVINTHLLAHSKGTIQKPRGTGKARTSKGEIEENQEIQDSHDFLMDNF